jgi:hypothetical protein
MLVPFRHPESTNGIPLEIEFDQHRRLIAHDPPVVTGLDGNDLRSYKLRSAPVCILDVNLTAGQEADVCVHAQFRADGRFHVGGPTKAWSINHPFDATGAGSDHIELDAANVAAFASLERREEWVSGIHEIFPLLSCHPSARLNSIRRPSVSYFGDPPAPSRSRMARKLDSLQSEGFSLVPGVAALDIGLAMPRVLDPLRFLLIRVAGWINQSRLQMIDCLREENRLLRKQLGGRPLLLK